MVLCVAIGSAAAHTTPVETATTRATTPSWAMTDAQRGDPPLEVRHRGLHLKKPRLAALQVCTLRAFHARASLVFGHGDGDAIPSGDDFARRPSPADSVHAHRADPALRLHPGQAPPHAA